MWWCTLPWLLLAGCQSSPTTKAQPITRLQPHLGTFVSITVYAEPKKARAGMDAAFAEFRAVDALLSIHRPDSDLARANAGDPASAELQRRHPSTPGGGLLVTVGGGELAHGLQVGASRSRGP